MIFLIRLLMGFNVILLKPATQIAKTYGCSASSVIRIINRHCHPKYREPVLPKHLCFDEFRST